jgi:hypothetical protein
MPTIETFTGWFSATARLLPCEQTGWRRKRNGEEAKEAGVCHRRQAIVI